MQRSVELVRESLRHSTCRLVLGVSHYGTAQPRHNGETRKIFTGLASRWLDRWTHVSKRVSVGCFGVPGDMLPVERIEEKAQRT